MPYLAASSCPLSSAVTMVMRSGGMPMWRSTSGSTPCPILPKPTKTIRPGNSTWILWLLLMILALGSPSVGRAKLRVPAAYQVGPAPLNFPTARVPPPPFSAVAPVRRVGALVAGLRGNPSEPAAEGRVVDLHRHEARGERRRLRLLERTAQQLDPRVDHHVNR